MPTQLTSVKSVITTHQLSKRYGKTQVVKNLNMRVPQGSIYGFLGPNGAGKTTTLRLMLGLARASGGSVQVLGGDLRKNPELRAQLGGMVEGPAFYPNLSARENLSLYARHLNINRERIDEVLEIVDLGAAANRPAGRYSLGMKQRLGIALALIGDPEVLILDEPQNGLDPAGMRDMRTLLKDLQAREHTLLISSHLLNEVAQLVTHVGFITGGQLVFEGTLEAVPGSGSLEQRYFDLTSREVMR